MRPSFHLTIKSTIEPKPHSPNHLTHERPHTGVLALTTLCAAAVNLAVEQPAANLLRLLMAGGGGGRRRSKESKDDACPPPVDWRRSQRRRSVTMTEDGDEGEEEERKAAQDGGMVELEMAVRAPGAAKYEV